MTTDPGNKSAAELEREVESQRGQVTRTLDELRERISPGQLVDQAVTYARESGGGEFTRNLGRSVRDNPLPILLIGAGIGWLMTTGGGSRGSAHRQAAPARPLPPAHNPSTGTMPTPTPHPTAARDPSAISQGQSAHAGLGASVTSIGRSVSGTASSAASKASGAASSASDAVSSAYSSATGAISSAYRSASGTAGDMAGTVSGAVGSAGSTVGGYASHLAHDTRDSAHRLGDYAQRNLSRLMEEQPLVLGALGVALGAAFGAALPSTRTENELMGETSDALKSQAKHAAGEQYDRAKAAAGETYREVVDDLDERGYSKGGAREALGSATDKVKSALHSAKDEAKDEIQKAGTPSGTGTSSTSPGTSSGGAGNPSTGSGTSSTSTGTSPGTTSPLVNTGGSTGSPSTTTSPGSTGSSTGSQSRST